MGDLADHADGEDYDDFMYEPSAGEEEEEEQESQGSLPRRLKSTHGKASSVSLKHRLTWQGWCLPCRFTTTLAMKP